MRLPRRLSCGALVLLASCMAPALARADSWVFQRSYYSHHPGVPVRIGVKPAVPSYYPRPTGIYVNSGFRNLRSTIRVGGRVYDNLNVWESWIQTGAQW